MKRLLLVLGIALLIRAAPATAQPPLSGTVVAVPDGDRLLVELPSRRLLLRLADVDAPELDQPHGPRARRALGELALGKRVQIVLLESESDPPVAARVMLAGSGESGDLARLLVLGGHAWVRSESPGGAALAGLERDARTSRRGLWAGHAPIAPRDWRAGKRSVR